jgi:hypothetical protein
MVFVPGLIKKMPKHLLWIILKEHMMPFRLFYKSYNIL